MAKLSPEVQALLAELGITKKRRRRPAAAGTGSPLFFPDRKPKTRGVGRPRKTHCIRGHEFTAKNARTYIDSRGNRVRTCRACNFIRYKNRLIAQALAEATNG